MISKKLLSEVLELKTTKDFNFEIEDNYVCISDYGEQLFEINIYELAHKCKEWASKYNFHLISWTISYEAVKDKGYCQTHNTQDATKESDKPFSESTEIEAIFKACEWILKERI